MKIRAAAVAALTLAVGLVLSACTSTAPTPSPSVSASPTASEGAADFNDADAMFATMMIPHHEQAIEMADLVLGKEGVDQRGGMLECGAVLEPVLHRPAVPVHHVEQPFDVGRANEHVGIDALPRDPFHPGVGRRRVTWLDLEQAVVDRRPLDVQEVDAVVVRKNLEGRVGEADAHRPGHRVRVHDTTVSGRYSPSGGDNG